MISIAFLELIQVFIEYQVNVKFRLEDYSVEVSMLVVEINDCILGVDFLKNVFESAFLNRVSKVETVLNVFILKILLTFHQI